MRHLEIGPGRDVDAAAREIRRRVETWMTVAKLFFFIVAASLLMLIALAIWTASPPRSENASPSVPTARLPAAAPAAPPAAPLRIRKMPLAIVLCKFRDKPAATRPWSFYRDYYTRLGTGGAADYWTAATLGAVDITDSEIFGWLTMSHDSSEVARLHFPGDRRALVQWGRDAAAAQGIDLSPYAGVVVIQNWGVDHGDAGNGIVIVDQNAALLESTFITHEMGHLFGLPHSFGDCGRPNGEYCDQWDLMSAMNVYSHTRTFAGASGLTGPGLNVFASRALGAFSGDRLLTLRKPGADETLRLAPLNRPTVAASLYAVEITPEASGGSLYSVEYRHKAGWDSGLPGDAVLIHEEKNQRSYLTRVLAAGNRYSAARFDVEVVSIDTAAERATVHIWTR